MADTIRTGVIGYGLAGSTFHAPLIDATDGMTVAAVVTGDPGRAAAARDRYPDVQVLPTADALFERADRLDLVVVASPNSSHVPLGLAAVEAGLPVVVDKPVAASTADARRLSEAAAARGVPVSVYHNRRWDGDLRTVRQLVADGAVGRVHRFESRYERWRPEPKAGAWREDPDPALAGGLLFDLGSHLVDQALLLFGPATHVYAEVAAVRAGAAVDDDVFIALTHASGVRTQLWASAAAAQLGPRFRLLGATGAYVKYGMDGQEAALRAGDTPRDAGWGTEPESTWGTLGAGDEATPVPTLPGAYQEFYAGVRDAVRGGAQVPVPIEEAIEVLIVLEAARDSARHSSVVTL
jgi:scyllo-inositol 2-dehydrogenase (NADP+)